MAGVGDSVGDEIPPLLVPIDDIPVPIATSTSIGKIPVTIITGYLGNLQHLLS